MQGERPPTQLVTSSLSRFAPKASWLKRARAAAAEGQGQEHAKARRDAEQALEQARAELVEAREKAARVGDLEARATRAEAQADAARQEAQGLTFAMVKAQKRILELESPTVEAGALGPVTERLESLDARTRWDPLAKMALGGLVVAVGGLGWMFSGAKSEVYAKAAEVAQVRGTLEGTQAQLLTAQSTALEAERSAREFAATASASQAERDQAQRDLEAARASLQQHQEAQAGAAMLRALLRAARGA